MAYNTSELKDYAISCYPNEACGIISGGVFIPCKNIASNPKQDFRIQPDIYRDFDIEAVFHSHPGGPEEPSEHDIKGQIDTDVPWILCVSYSDSASEPYEWGGDYIPPLVGRDFRHGPSGTDDRGDCYALIKDYYKLELDIRLPEYPRSPEWWKSGCDLYVDNFQNAGFCEVQGDNPQVGDVALMAINSETINHAAVYIGDGLILQHLANRLSRRDPAALWNKLIKKWVRFGANQS